MTKFPKRYTFYVSQHIAASAAEAHALVKKANSVYPTTKHEAELRREFFMRAYAEYQNLISQVNVAYEIFPIPDNAMIKWMSLIDHELSLIKAVIKKDRERYKTLKE